MKFVAELEQFICKLSDLRCIYRSELNENTFEVVRGVILHRMWKDIERN